jgi:stearoyl-CoA desaturase (delta-9 desaturase)
MSTISSRVHNDDIIYPSAIAFVLVHLACFAVFWTGVRPIDVAVCIALYLIRMFAITAGLHRYFSHKSFKTGRVFQFVLAFVAETSAQSGAIWWAAKHREHHKYSDTPQDVHSPAQSGFFHAHVGWIFTRRSKTADYGYVKDLTRYPELVWLNEHNKFPAILLALAVGLTLGWSGLVVGFFMSTVLVYHGTFAINSLAHVYGKQRYVTGDDSRNNWLLALITLGEGWHNNHHHYQASTRQGFYWWEIDVTFYVLKVLSWFRIVRELRSPPPEVVRGERRLNKPLIEKTARDLAGTFSLQSIKAEIRQKWEQMPDLPRPNLQVPDIQMPDLEELRARTVQAREQARVRFETWLAEWEEWDMPSLPTFEELKERAQERYAQSPSMDEIVDRARQILVEALCDELMPEPMTPATDGLK